MKKFILLFLCMMTLSCESDETISADQLVGTWQLEDKTLTFINSNFQFEFNDTFLAGYFTLEDNIFEGICVIKRGQDSANYIENFNGKVSLSGNKLIFSEFTGAWSNVFTSSYIKID